MAAFPHSSLTFKYEGVVDLTPKQKIAKILDIPESNSWFISDSRVEKDLYIIYTSNDADMSKYGFLTGMIIDIKYEVIVSKAYGYTPIVVADEFKKDIKGDINLRDEFGEIHSLKDGSYSMAPGFDGVLIRIFKHRGIIYRASHRKLDVGKSKWGDSRTFGQMYEDLDGPDGEKLFSPEFDYSIYSHGWMIVTKELANVTKANLGDGYLVYLGPVQNFEAGEKCPFPVDEVDIEIWIPDNLTSDPNLAKKGNYLHPAKLTLDQANYRLRWGDYKEWDDSDYDPRLGTGEFVIIYVKDDKDQITNLIRVESSAYAWRNFMRDNDPNLLHRFYQLINFSYIPAQTPDGLLEFQRKMPIMAQWDIESVINHIFTVGPITTWWQNQELTDELVKTKDGRLYNAWACLLVSVPLHSQLTVAKMYNDFFPKRLELVAWLQDIEDIDDLDNPNLIDRVSGIIQISRVFAQRKTEHGEIYGKHGKILDIKDLTRDAIRNLIFKENGTSLYKLVRNMNREKQKQIEENTKPEEV